MAEADAFTGRRAGWRSAALVAVLVLAGYGLLEASSDHYFLWDDNAAYFLPLYVYNAETLAEEGALAHWNAHQYMGIANLASGQPAVLYPPVYMAYGLARLVWGDARPMMDLLAIGHFLIAALGMLGLLTRRGVPRTVAILCSLLWISFPFLNLVARNWIWVSYGAAFLPASFWLLDRLVERPVPARVVAFGACKALFFLQGYVQYVVYSALFEGFYLAWRLVLEKGSRRRSLRGMAGFALGLLTSGALAAPLLVPMGYARSISQYRSERLSVEEYLSNSLVFKELGPAQVFDMVIRAVHEATGAIFYFGIPVLVGVAVLLWVRFRRRAEADPSADRQESLHRSDLVALATAATALVLSTKATVALYQLPLLGSFRWPFKCFLFFLFFLVIGLAEGWSRNWNRTAIRRIVGAAVALGIAGNLYVLSVPDWGQPFGPNRLPVDVSAFRASAAAQLPSLENGRFASMWSAHQQPEIERFLVHNYATLADAYHLGGYEPLVSKLNFELAAGLEYSNIWWYQLNRSSLDYLSSWGVRYLVAPNLERNAGYFAAFPELRPVYSDDLLLVVENQSAAPFAFFAATQGQEQAAVPVRFHGNGLEIDTAGRQGPLRVLVAPIDWLRWFVDGVDQGPPTFVEDGRIVLDVPAETEKVELRYVDVPFRIGVGICLLFLAGLVLFARISRRRSD